MGKKGDKAGRIVDPALEKLPRRTLPPASIAVGPLARSAHRMRLERAENHGRGPQ